MAELAALPPQEGAVPAGEIIPTSCCCDVVTTCISPGCWHWGEELGATRGVTALLKSSLLRSWEAHSFCRVRKPCGSAAGAWTAGAHWALCWAWPCTGHGSMLGMALCWAWLCTRPGYPLGMALSWAQLCAGHGYGDLCTQHWAGGCWALVWSR